MFKRIVNLSKTHSFFLFGARSTGKSTLLEERFSPETSIWLDLLKSELSDQLAQQPESLRSIIQAQPQKKWIVIDEIQKVPELLNVIHSLSSNKTLKFALTGSSARKLKRGGANLLAGRAFRYFCHPLLHIELKDRFVLDEVLQFGSLPEIFSLDFKEKNDFLRAYVENYFKEEIVSEQLIRKLRPFKNFLHVASQMNSKILNFNRIAQDVGVDHTTIHNYFEILEDTLVGFLLEPFHESIRKRQRQSAKFYYFDIGVTRALKKVLEVKLQSGSYDYGECFEQFIILEAKRLIDYFKPDWSLSYLRTKDDAEIDLIIERPGLTRVAIEIKSTKHINNLGEPKTKSFMQLTKDLKNFECFVFSQDPLEKKVDHVHFLPWQKGFKEIGLTT